MKKYLPKEHGAWLIFLVPAFSGILAVRDGNADSTVPASAYLLLILTGFILSKPISAFSSERESLRDYFDGILLLLFILVIASYFLIEAGRFNNTLVILSPLFLLFFLSAFLVKPSQSAFLKRISGIFFPLSAIGGYYSYHGTVDLNAYLLYLLNVLYFFPKAIFTSEYFVEKKRTFLGNAGLINIFSLIIILFLYLSYFINIKIMMVFAFFSIPTFLTLAGILQWKSIRKFGKTELCFSVLFLICLVTLYCPCAQE